MMASLLKDQPVLTLCRACKTRSFTFFVLGGFCVKPPARIIPEDDQGEQITSCRPQSGRPACKTHSVRYYVKRTRKGHANYQSASAQASRSQSPRQQKPRA